MSKLRSEAKTLRDPDLFANREPSVLGERTNSDRRTGAPMRPVLSEAEATDGSWNMVPQSLEIANQRVLWIALFGFVGFAAGVAFMMFLVG